MKQDTYGIKTSLIFLLSISSIVFIIPKIIINIFYEGNMDYFDYISKLSLWTSGLIFILVIIIVLLFYWTKNNKNSTNNSSDDLFNFKVIFGLIIIFIVLPIFIFYQFFPLFKDLPIFIDKKFSHCEGELIKVTSTTGRGAHNDAYICNMKFEISSDLKDSLVPGNKYKVTYLPNSKLPIKFEEK